jgi:hypothetical protein
MDSDSDSDNTSRPSLSPADWPELPLANTNSNSNTPTSTPPSQTTLSPPSFWRQLGSSSEQQPEHEREDSQSSITSEIQIVPPSSSSESDDPEHTVAADVVEESEQIVDTDMATSLGTSPGDSRRNNVISPRPKGRENSKNTLCRNIGIYGHCRYENEGCAFNHDVNSLKTNPNQSMENRLVLSMLLCNWITWK